MNTFHQHGGGQILGNWPSWGAPAPQTPRPSWGGSAPQTPRTWRLRRQQGSPQWGGGGRRPPPPHLRPAPIGAGGAGSGGSGGAEPPQEGRGVWGAGAPQEGQPPKFTYRAVLVSRFYWRTLI